jgi:hypothetical protein
MVVCKMESLQVASIKYIQNLWFMHCIGSLCQTLNSIQSANLSAGAIEVFKGCTVKVYTHNKQDTGTIQCLFIRNMLGREVCKYQSF